MNFELISQFVVSAIAIFFAAGWLTRACDEIAQISGLGRLFIGGLFLAASTSAPEFFVNIQATLKGAPNLAVGDLLGASMVNLTIFSILAFLFRSMREPEPVPGIGVASLLAAFLTAEIGFLIHFKPSWQFVGVNIGSILLIGTYLLGVRFLFRKTQALPAETPRTRLQARKLFRPILQLFLAAMVIFFASPLLVSSMETLSARTGLGQTLVGTTLLALTTSFPELVTSVTALRMGHFDLMLGNIVGSNALNMTIFVFMDWIWKDPPLWDHLSEQNILVAGVVVLNMLLVAFSWGCAHKRYPAVKWAGTVLILLFNLACYGILFSGWYSRHQ